MLYDIRKKLTPIAKLEDHSKEVCGLKWKLNGEVLASGGYYYYILLLKLSFLKGNDNKINIWNLKTLKKEASYTSHKGGVKALAWNPKA